MADVQTGLLPGAPSVFARRLHTDPGEMPQESLSRQQRK
jgi:hypothetical protein